MKKPFNRKTISNVSLLYLFINCRLLTYLLRYLGWIVEFKLKHHLVLSEFSDLPCEIDFPLTPTLIFDCHYEYRTIKQLKASWHYYIPVKLNFNQSTHSDSLNLGFQVLVDMILILDLVLSHWVHYNHWGRWCLDYDIELVSLGDGVAGVVVLHSY